jgi:hypothetical protein
MKGMITMSPVPDYIGLLLIVMMTLGPLAAGAYGY